MDIDIARCMRCNLGWSFCSILTHFQWFKICFTFQPSKNSEFEWTVLFWPKEDNTSGQRSWDALVAEKWIHKDRGKIFVIFRIKPSMWPSSALTKSEDCSLSSPETIWFGRTGATRIGAAPHTNCPNLAPLCSTAFCMTHQCTSESRPRPSRGWWITLCCISFQPKLVLCPTPIVQIWHHFGELHFAWLIDARLGLGLDPDLDGELRYCCISFQPKLVLHHTPIVQIWHHFGELHFVRRFGTQHDCVWHHFDLVTIHATSN